MKTTAYAFTLSVFLALASVSTQAQAFEHTCDQTVGIGNYEKGPSLSGLSVYDGHPTQNAVLKPTSESRSFEGLEIIHWSYEALAIPEKWLSCNYQATDQKSFIRIPDYAKVCTAFIERPSKREVHIRFSCLP